MAITAAELMVTVGADTTAGQAGIRSFGDQLNSAARTMGTAGMALSAGVTAPLVGIGVAAFAVGRDFESAFTGVIKTVDASETQIAGLREGILEMARVLPASAAEIAGVAEAAGQLGIKTDSILDFTRVMIDLGETTNLEASSAATQLARLANITGMSQDDFGRLGSTIVALGNNLATTESDIVSMAMRIAGAGKQVGMSESDILSFAGALSSVGIEAEAGGSAISRVFIDMANAVASGGEDLSQFATVAGMSADEFAKAFETNAAGAMVSFIQGLDGISESGGNVFAVLEDMGLSEIRTRDALLRAAGASDIFTGAIEIGSRAWIENTALTTEAGLRYGTTASKIDTLKNRVVELGINGFERLKPTIDKALDSLGKIMDWIPTLIQRFTDLDPAIRNGVLAFGAVFAAAGPVLLALSGIAFGLAFLLSPIGLVVIAVGLLAAAWASDFGGMRTMITEWWAGIQPTLATWIDWFTAQIPAALQRLREIWASVWEALPGIITSVQAAIQPAIDGIIGVWGRLVASALGIIERVRSAWDKFPETMNNARDAATNVFAGVQEGWAKLSKFLAPATARITEAFGDMMAGFSDMGGTFAGLGEALGDLGVALEPIIAIVGVVLVGALTGAMNAIAAIMKHLPAVVEIMVKKITNIIDTIAGILSEATALVKAVIDGDWAAAWESLKNIGATAMGGLLTAMQLGGELIGIVLLALKDVIVNTLADFGVDVKSPFDEVEKSVRTFWAWLTGLSWDDVWSGLGNGFAGLIDTMVAWEWPSLADLTGWSWPSLATLTTWGWPTLPTWTWPGYLKFDWPGYPRFEWPSIEMPDWWKWPFAGGGDNNAAGNTNFGGGMTWVGERGPELVSLPGGSRIYNNQESMAMAGSGGVSIGEVHIHNDMDVEALINRIARGLDRRMR